jgi:hypothetical protein
MADNTPVSEPEEVPVKHQWTVARILNKDASIEYRCTCELTNEFFSVTDDPNYVTRITGVQV